MLIYTFGTYRSECILYREILPLRALTHTQRDSDGGDGGESVVGGGGERVLVEVQLLQTALGLNRLNVHICDEVVFGVDVDDGWHL